MHKPLFHSFSMKLSISAHDHRGRGEGKSFSTIFTEARPWLKITGPGVWAYTLGEQVLQLSCAVMLCWTEVDTNLPHCSMWTIGSLRFYDGDGHNNATKQWYYWLKEHKKSWGTCSTDFSKYVCGPLYNDDVKSPDLRFWRQREHATKNLSFSIYTL